MITADGKTRVANPYTNPDLFWALIRRGRGQPRRCEQTDYARARAAGVLGWGDFHNQSFIG